MYKTCMNCGMKYYLSEKMCPKRKCPECGERLKMQYTQAKDILRYTKQRHANKKVYLEFMNSKKKAKFRAEHEPEIILYEAATRELKKLLDGKPVPSEKKTFARIQELSQKKN